MRERAEVSFLKAIEIADGQEARMLELRAATDLTASGLWRDTGAPNDPRALLEPILAVPAVGYAQIAAIPRRRGERVESTP